MYVGSVVHDVLRYLVLVVTRDFLTTAVGRFSPGTSTKSPGRFGFVASPAVYGNRVDRPKTSFLDGTAA